ncbi:hypothetical protein J6590_069302, partial [Homalodisca vitripennis]
VYCIYMVGLKVGTHITAPRPTRQSAVCWPSYGERIAAQFSTCKSTHVRTDTRPSWPHRARTVTDMFSLNFDGHVSVTSNSKETCSSTNSEIVALGLHTEMCGLTVTEPSPHRQSADSRVGHGAVIIWRFEGTKSFRCFRFSHLQWTAEGRTKEVKAFVYVWETTVKEISTEVELRTISSRNSSGKQNRRGHTKRAVLVPRYPKHRLNMFVKSHGMGNASDVYHPGYYFCGGKPQPYIQGLNGVRGLYWIRSLIYRAKESGVPVWTTPKSSRMKEKTEIVLPNSRRFDTVVQVRVDQEIIETMRALMYLNVMLDTNFTVWDHIFVVPNKVAFLPSL